jgi:hypothetical protein
VRQTRAAFRPSNTKGSRGFESAPLGHRVQSLRIRRSNQRNSPRLRLHSHAARHRRKPLSGGLRARPSESLCWQVRRFHPCPKHDGIDSNFYDISTNFDLPSDQVRALISMGCTLLKDDPGFNCMLEDLERKAAGRTNVSSACSEKNRDFHPLAAQQIVCPDPGPWPGS